MSLIKVFAIYSNSQKVEAAVDRLLSSGFRASAISALHPDNQSTREFAQRKGTRPPANTAEGTSASVPLDGTWGLLDPGAGPVTGALSSALADMGVPPEWCERRVVDGGKVLLSVKCDRPEQVADVAEILRATGAEEVDSAVGSTEETSQPKAERRSGGEQEPWSEIGSRNT